MILYWNSSPPAPHPTPQVYLQRASLHLSLTTVPVSHGEGATAEANAVQAVTGLARVCTPSPTGRSPQLWGAGPLLLPGRLLSQTLWCPSSLCASDSRLPLLYVSPQTRILQEACPDPPDAGGLPLTHTLGSLWPSAHSSVQIIPSLITKADITSLSTTEAASLTRTVFTLLAWTSFWQAPFNTLYCFYPILNLNNLFSIVCEIQLCCFIFVGAAHYFLLLYRIQLNKYTFLM